MSQQKFEIEKSNKGKKGLSSKLYTKNLKFTNVTLVANYLLQLALLESTSKPFTKAAKISIVTLVENHLLQMVN